MRIDGMELDIVLTQDGIPVIFNDTKNIAVLSKWFYYGTIMDAEDTRGLCL